MTTEKNPEEKTGDEQIKAAIAAKEKHIEALKLQWDAIGTEIRDQTKKLGKLRKILSETTNQG